ncbi:MAG: class I adenylate-forming enzyme family protein [Acidimicrobiales bacterium]
MVTRPAPAAPDHAEPPQDAVTLLGGTARRHPGAEAFVESSGERITFAQWDAAADGVAAALADRGVVAGNVVCLLLPSSIRYMVCYQAAMRLGAVTSGVNLRLGPSETTYILERSTPRVTVVEDGTGDRLPPSAGGVVGWGELEGWSASAPPPLATLGPGSPVAICWTGGTTGRPKGVLFDQANLAAVAEASGVLSAPFDRRLSPLPFAHVGTMTRAFDEIGRVITTVITPPHWTAAEALRLLGSERVTVAQGVPTQWELVLRDPSLGSTDLSSLRLAASGASRVPPDLLRRMREALGVPVVNRYASTEAAIICGTRPDDPDDVVTETLGRPEPSVELRVADGEGRAVAPGEVGRVQVRSGAVMRGYWRDPEATAEVLDAEGWLTVGDLGALGTDGNLRFMGRMGDSYLRGAYNVYPVEVERELAEHPRVAQVAVVAAPDPVLGEIGVAYVVADEEVGAAELAGWVGARLADYKRPDRVFFVDEFPLTALGKVDRRRLAADAAERLGAGGRDR